MEHTPVFLTEVKTFVRDKHEQKVFEHHSGHKKPQIEHLQEVAVLVWVSGGGDTEIAAGWLHDTVEDTAVTLEEIRELFGAEVAEIVHGLTDTEEMEKLPLLDRKRAQALRVKAEGLSVRRVKLCDQISNIKYIVTDPPAHWSRERNRDYCIGAKLIADECRGISPLLDQLFANQYARAKEIFSL